MSLWHWYALRCVTPILDRRHAPTASGPGDHADQFRFLIRLRVSCLGASQYSPGMTAPDPTDVARKLRQHDNEFEAVYDLLSVVDGKIDALEAKVDAGFARLESGQQQILDLLRGRGTSSSD